MSFVNNVEIYCRKQTLEQERERQAVFHPERKRNISSRVLLVYFESIICFFYAVLDFHLKHIIFIWKVESVQAFHSISAPFISKHCWTPPKKAFDLVLIKCSFRLWIFHVFDIYIDFLLLILGGGRLHLVENPSLIYHFSSTRLFLCICKFRFSQISFQILIPRLSIYLQPGFCLMMPACKLFSCCQGE